MSDAKTFLVALATILVVSAGVAAAPTGAAAQSDTAPPLDPAHCQDGTYVEEPASYAGLVVDCILLVTIRNHFMSNPANSEIDWDSPWKGTDISNGRVRSLDLNNNQLTGTIPTELALLTGLEWLGLPRNQFTGSIPAELENLTNLRVLGLDGNQLTGQIPLQLTNLTNLQWLALDDNQISGIIPSELGDLTQLGHLSLGGNQLSGPIPSQLGELSLNELWVQGNQLSGEIPTTLRVAQSFRFCGNPLTGALPVHLRPVAQYFSGNVDDVSSCYEGAFRDDDGSPHEASIEQIVEWGITQGCADERFCPSRTVTRAQMAAFLYRATTHLYGAPDPADEVQLSDVGANAWYRTYAQWAIANTVMRAPGGDFNPQAAVTRSDMAEMFVAAFDHLSASPEAQDLFSDVAGLPDAAIRAMEGVYDAEVITGCSTAPLRYCPTEEVTRAQMASFLTRAVLLGQA